MKAEDKKLLGFYLQPSFPQYRKIVRGKQKKLDGTETSRSNIVKYDYNPVYKDFMAAIVKSHK